MKKLFVILFCGLLLMNLSFDRLVSADDYAEEDNYVQIFSNNSIPVDKKKIPYINALAAVVIDTRSGRVLYEKQAYSRRSMASTTKIMTAIVAIEKGNLTDVVTVSKRAASIWGSDIKLREGEKLSLRELLYGLMLKSGNDAAIAIAEHIGGSVEGFCEMMNRKAEELGCKNTNFKSPHGLDMPDHYTTAYELALITRYALNNPTFAKIVATHDTTITGRALHNTNELLGAYPGADGVKTGYTGQAGRCLVTSATRSNWKIISVVLGSPTRNARAESSKSILDYAFDNYKQYTILKSGKLIGKMTVFKGINGKVPVIATDTITLPLREDEVNSIKTQVTYPDIMEAPINQDVEVGSIKFLIDDKIIAESAIKTAEEVKRKDFFDYFGDIIKEWGRIMRN